MKHTKYENITDVEPDAVITWLQSKFGKNTPLGVWINRDNTVKKIEIGKKLSIADKKLITDKYPELEGKEIG